MDRKQEEKNKNEKEDVSAFSEILNYALSGLPMLLLKLLLLVATCGMIFLLYLYGLEAINIYGYLNSPPIIEIEIDVNGASVD
jgi:hypothetical protein